MKRAIALLFLCEFLTTGLASAQGAPAQAPPPQTNASPIEVTAQPEHGATGTPVTIHGTVAGKGSNAVTITVKPPSGAPISHTVSPDANGAFTLQYPDTKTSGTYSVQATLGASSAAATFGIGSTDMRAPPRSRAQSERPRTSKLPSCWTTLRKRRNCGRHQAQAVLLAHPLW